MTVWLIMFLFNVNTQKFGDPATFVASYDSIDACSRAAISQGVQKPDENGFIKLYDCQIPKDSTVL